MNIYKLSSILFIIICYSCSNTTNDNYIVNFIHTGTRNKRVDGEFILQIKRIEPSTYKYSYKCVDSIYSSSFDYTINYKLKNGFTIWDDTLDIRFINSKKYIINNNEITVYLFIENEWETDGSSYVYFVPEFGLINSRNPSWGNKRILSTINKGDEEIAFEELNKQILNDSLFYKYPYRLL